MTELRQVFRWCKIVLVQVYPCFTSHSLHSWQLATYAVDSQPEKPTRYPLIAVFSKICSSLPLNAVCNITPANLSTLTRGPIPSITSLKFISLVSTNPGRMIKISKLSRRSCACASSSFSPCPYTQRIRQFAGEEATRKSEIWRKDNAYANRPIILPEPQRLRLIPLRRLTAQVDETEFLTLVRAKGIREGLGGGEVVVDIDCASNGVDG